MTKLEIYKQLWERREAYRRNGKVVYAVPLEVIEELLKSD